MFSFLIAWCKYKIKLFQLENLECIISYINTTLLLCVDVHVLNWKANYKSELVHGAVAWCNSALMTSLCFIYSEAEASLQVWHTRMLYYLLEAVIVNWKGWLYRNFNVWPYALVFAWLFVLCCFCLFFDTFSSKGTSNS